MSVSLTSLNGKVGENVSNGSWAAIVAVARIMGEDVSEWNGCHDGQIWYPKELLLMAGRIKQIAELVPILEELARNEGVTIS